MFLQTSKDTLPGVFYAHTTQHTAKVADRDLSRIQTFVQNFYALPLTAILDTTNKMSIRDIKEASVMAVKLIGNDLECKDI